MSEEKNVDIVETLEPAAQVYSVTLAEGTDAEVTLYQKPLSFFGKIELFSVLGAAVEKALSEGTTIAELLDVPDKKPDEISGEALKEADVFIKALARAVQFAPDLFEEIYCIALRVPRGQRDYIKELLREEDDEKMMGVANTFVNQNWQAMMDFFSEQISPLIANISERLQSESTSSKPSNPTRARTPKQ
jgi:hypothetical protein